MPTDTVYIGPSLSAEEAAQLLPGARILPPVAHGDLLRLDPAPGDRVFIVDGLFLHAAPVRHREILLLLQRGVVVAGASSMGALRAAELWQYGMCGVGDIFDLYRDGTICGDDEVAIVHAPPEAGYRALSEPLVNIRIALCAAVAAGVIDHANAAHLTDVVQRMPFRARSYRALRDVSRAAPFLAWLDRHPIDAKANDARTLLRLAAAGDPRLRRHGEDDWPIEHVRTRYLDNWQARHAGTTAGGRWVSEAELVTTVMLLHPDFPAQHRAHVLARLAGATDGVEQRAVDLARDLGLLQAVAAGLPEPSWLTPAEAGLPPEEAALRVLVRAQGTASPRSVSWGMLPPPLTAGTVLSSARQVVATAQKLNQRIPPADPRVPDRRRQFRPDAVIRRFADVWHCEPEQMLAAVWDRGFEDLESFLAAAEPLTAYLKVFGQPFGRSPQLATVSGGTR